MAFNVTSSTATTSPAIAVTSPASDSDRMDWAWPAGSGLNNYTIRVCNPANSLLTNGQFETNTIANLPDGWIPTVATPGTSLLVTAPACRP